MYTLTEGTSTLPTIAIQKDSVSDAFRNICPRCRNEQACPWGIAPATKKEKAEKSSHIAYTRQRKAGSCWSSAKSNKHRQASPRTRVKHAFSFFRLQQKKSINNNNETDTIAETIQKKITETMLSCKQIATVIIIQHTKTQMRLRHEMIMIITTAQH